MKIQLLALHNIRGFSSLRLDFTDMVTGQARPRTVIVGSNGSGKTTMLDAIYELLGAFKGHHPKWLFSPGISTDLIICDLPKSRIF